MNRRPAREVTRFPRENNFDLIRLLAAVQVVYFHTTEHLKITTLPLQDALKTILAPLSGVPIFFVISGFLISASYERRAGLGYVRNRVLRIYPALWVCFGATLVILGVEGFLANVWKSPRFIVWIFAQLTIGQSFNIGAFRHFGVGTPNGSLWTIPVELTFYLAVPFMYLAFVRRRSPRTANLAFAGVCAMSFAVAMVVGHGYEISLFDRLTRLVEFSSHQHLTAKVLGASAAPYLYLFVLGVLAQRNFRHIARFVEGRVLFWTLPYFFLADHVGLDLNSSFVQNVEFAVSRLLLVGLVLSLAFSFNSASRKVLRGVDASYGTYVFHLLIVNVLVQEGHTRQAWLLPLVILASVTVGVISWKLVEHPALQLKDRTDVRATART